MKISSVVFGLAIAIAIPACPGVQGTATVHAGATVVYQEPPQPQIEKVVERSGYIWVKGHWDWQNGQWAWIGGHWEKERGGSQWRDGRWERRGSAWHWVPGEWVGGGVVVGGNVGGSVDVEYPDRAPPEPEIENPGSKADHVWIAGRWEWKRGKWEWTGGRWEPARPSYSWQPGRWERRGNRWEWIEGRWEAEVVVDVNVPTSAPPAPRAENPGYKPNHVWIEGRWEWKGGKWEWTGGRWEKARKEKWTPGRWEQQGGRWTWIEGSWGGGGGGAVTISVEFPDKAPPADRDEGKPYKPGHVWVKGRWDWKGGKWEWTPGKYEKARDKKKWVDGKWEQQGGKWVWVDGRWE